MRSFLAKLWRFLHLPRSLQLAIMRFVNGEFLVGVTGIIFDGQGRVLVLEHTYRRVKWSLPGGYLMPKEHPSEAVEREIMEETGMTVSADSLFKVRTDRETGRLDMCYIGTYIGGAFRPSTEVTGYKFCHFEELPLVLDDQVLLIKEAMTRRNAKKST